ncbi:MAG TPA: hypothetical protein VFX70_11630, partial [Mycobacteriales bacterium]|nr:hypothetical protein [Mycobacteriales bacterium]
MGNWVGVWSLLPAVLLAGPCVASMPGAPLAHSSARVAVAAIVGVAGIVLTGVAVAAVAAMRGRARRAMAGRVGYELVPTNSFDPTAEDVRRFAEQLRRTRAVVSWPVPRRACGVRVRLSTGCDGRLGYRIEGHRRAESVLRQPTYAQVEVRAVELAEPVDTGRPSGEMSGQEGSPQGSVDPAHGRPVFVARAELVLAADPAQALRAVPMAPDPLQSLAAAVAGVDAELGERVAVCLDLLPLTPARVARLRRTYARRSASPGSPAGRFVATVAEELRADWRGGRGSRPVGRGDRRAADVGKFGTDEPVFAVQVLVRVESRVPGRVQAHLHQILSAFDVWSGANRWRVRGVSLGAGPVVVGFLGADSVWRRRRFDRRFASGECRPHRRNLLTAGELAGFLKPPTRWCAHRNVVRSGGMVPPVPRDLPVYTGQPGVIPLGYAPGHDGVERLVGVPLDDLTFSFRVGKSRYGKTELALVQAAAIAYAGGGVWFLDPHADGWRRARPFLTDPAVRDRVWEVDLTLRGDQALICSWNPLSMHGRSVADVEVVV